MVAYRPMLPWLRWLSLRARHGRALAGYPFPVHRGFVLELAHDGRLAAGRGLQIRRDVSFSVRGTLELGPSVFFNRGCYVAARESVRIGGRCRFGEYSSVHDADHVYGPALNTPHGREQFRSSPVVIGDDVWVGAHASVLRGVRIGDRSVVAAGAVVTSDVPADSLVGGVPARVLRTWVP